MDTFNVTWWQELNWRGHALRNDGREFCEIHPFTLHSYGVWERIVYKSFGMSFWEYQLPLLEIMILSAFILWRFFDILFKKLGARIPKFTSMMLAGIVLSRTFFLSHDNLVHKIFFPHDTRAKIPETLGAFGFTMYWFLRGVTMDVGMLKRTGPKAGLIGLSTMLVPWISGKIITFVRHRTWSALTMTNTEYRIITFMESLSAFTSINALLRDLKMNHSEFGRIAQSSAMVTDLVAFIITFSTAVALNHSYGIWQTANAILFFAAMIYVIRPAMCWVIRQTPEGRPVKDVYIYAILALAFLSFHYWKRIGLFGPAGSFVLGLAIPHGPPLGSALVQKFESFNIGIILPLFGSISMMQVDLQWLREESVNAKNQTGPVYETMSFILLISAMKFISSTVSAFSAKLPWRVSAVLALVLSNKGIFELSYFLCAVELKAFHKKVFTIVATSLLLNSLIIPIAIDFLYEPSQRFASYRKRNLLNLKPESELQTLVCINKSDHINSLVNILEAFHPSKDSPLTCYILHLIKLVGQANPTFISHQMQKPKSGNRSCSENVITSFRKFHRDFIDSISVHMFTSVSLARHMDEDICWLALDKSLTLILLPFHRTWSLDRSTVVSDDETLRNLNRNVLKRAPCSVGVLVYRNPIWETQMAESRCRVCLIFVGGKDDREALALTNRMRLMNPRISLTFVRFIPIAYSGESDEWMQMQTLSTADLKEILRSNNNSNAADDNSVTYIDKTVADGTETSRTLRSMAYDYDLFVVGRSSGMDTAVTKGLREWIEFEELGVIGDLLASPDYPSRTSVLVVQQQEYVAHG